MSKFSTGKYALGISDRSGFVYRLNDMKLEWTGSLVGADEWEKKQPQLDPRKHIMDPQALRNPRPTTPSVLMQGQQPRTWEMSVSCHWMSLYGGGMPT